MDYNSCMHTCACALTHTHTHIAQGRFEEAVEHGLQLVRRDSTWNDGAGGGVCVGEWVGLVACMWSSMDYKYDMIGFERRGRCVGVYV